MRTVEDSFAFKEVFKRETNSFVSIVNIQNMDKQKNKLGISSNISKLNVGDKVYTSDFTFDGEKEFFDTKVFVIDKVQISHIDGTSVPYYEMHDERFPKTVVKSDLKTGYFLSEKDAQKAFVEMIQSIAIKAEAVYKSKYDD